jgi:acetyl-CoA carboxylase biotin carboxyl carrier protein
LDLKQIKQIIELMKRSELSEFAVEEEGFKLKIRRGMGGPPAVTGTVPAGAHMGAGEPFHATSSLSSAQQPAATPLTAPAPAEEAGVAYVKSPMVGTFYRAPSPESKPFVEPGAIISETSVVCIIEAMKIMNEIQAEAKGTIVEVLVENGQPVEFGQKLFKLKAA